MGPSWQNPSTGIVTQSPHHGLGQQVKRGFPHEGGSEARRGLKQVPAGNPPQLQAWDHGSCLGDPCFLCHSPSPALFLLKKLVKVPNPCSWGRMKFLMMSFQVLNPCLTSCSQPHRLFILPSHVNPFPISTCSHAPAPALAATEQRENKFRVCFWVPYVCLSPSYPGYQFGRSPSAGSGLRTWRWWGEGRDNRLRMGYFQCMFDFSSAFRAPH